MKRISWVESTLGKNASVKKGLENPNDIAGSTSSDKLSWGLMQLTLKTAKDFDSQVTPQKLNNPDYSIKISAQYIKLLMRYFTKERDIVMAYNQGQGNQLKFVSLENSGKLKASDFPQARHEYERYLIAKSMFV